MVTSKISTVFRDHFLSKICFQKRYYKPQQQSKKYFLDGTNKINSFRERTKVSVFFRDKLDPIFATKRSFVIKRLPDDNNFDICPV